MLLNYIFIGLILLSIGIGVIQAALGNPTILSDILGSTFTGAKSGFEISLGLTGVLSLWMGIMKIGEKGGVIRTLANGVSPFFRRIFPGIPAGHKVYGSMFMNIAANMLGLDNAATPVGLKAMGELQELNEDKSRASNAMIMFVVLGASGLTLIPTTIMAYRAQAGAANPADIFLPILIATYAATLVGFLATCLWQKIALKDPVILGTIGVLTGVMGVMVWGASRLNEDQLTVVSSTVAASVLLGTIAWFVIQAMCHKVNVYDTFIEGAKEGFQTAVMIIPYLVAILVAVGMFRASGGMEWLERGLAWTFDRLGINPDMSAAVPTAIMKPLSGSGARGLMLEAMASHGADSLVGRLCCILQGTTDTTFYVLAVYFGSVGIRHTRHALACCLLADLAGVITAFLVAGLFFG